MQKNTDAIQSGDVTITFDHPSVDNPKELKVCIETKRLRIRTIQESDIDNMQSVFSDPAVMEKYATGQPKTDENYSKNRVKNIWRPRWEQGDPFSGMVVETKDTKEFVGIVVVGYCDAVYIDHGAQTAMAEVAYLNLKKYWSHKHNQGVDGKGAAGFDGIGQEITIAMANHYAAALIKRECCFQVTPPDSKVKKPYKFCGITATARKDHPGSIGVLEAAGFAADKTKINHKFGFDRYDFVISKEMILKKHATLCKHAELHAPKKPEVSLFDGSDKKTSSNTGVELDMKRGLY